MPRSQPLMIAPAIPLLGIAGIFGIDRLHGTPYLPAFVITWALLLAALFVYVFTRMLRARRARPGR
jgi:hypothetical protein